VVTLARPTRVPSVLDDSENVNSKQPAITHLGLQGTAQTAPQGEKQNTKKTTNKNPTKNSKKIQTKLFVFSVLIPNPPVASLFSFHVSGHWVATHALLAGSGALQGSRVFFLSKNTSGRFCASHRVTEGKGRYDVSRYLT